MAIQPRAPRAKRRSTALRRASGSVRTSSPLATNTLNATKIGDRRANMRFANTGPTGSIGRHRLTVHNAASDPIGPEDVGVVRAAFEDAYRRSVLSTAPILPSKWLRAKTCALDRADAHEHIFAAVIRLDEAEALFGH
jgi:hypothetical protein